MDFIIWDEDFIIKKNRVEKRLKAENINKLLNLIIHFILQKGVDENGYTDIHSKYFYDTYSGYNIYIKELRHQEKIERSNYEVGEKAFGYRFTNYFKNNIEIKNVIFPPQSRSQLRLRCKDDNTTNYISDEIKKRIRKDFLSCKIDFDLKKNQLEKTKIPGTEYIDIVKWLSNNANIAKWQNKNRYFNWSNNRLYTNFTSLSEHIRLNNIRLNNEPLVTYDIRSSFPLFLGIYCLSVDPSIYYDYDYKEYCTSVLNGTFYDQLRDGINSVRNCDRLESQSDAKKTYRDEAKVLFQQYLNGNMNRKGYINGRTSLIKDYFKLKYESIHNVVVDIKNAYEKVYDILVELETKFIFSVIEELYLIDGKIKIITCHDAIYIPQSYKEKADIIWENHMRKLTLNLPYIKEVEESDVLFDDVIFDDEMDDDELSNHTNSNKYIDYDGFFEDDEDDFFL